MKQLGLALMGALILVGCGGVTSGQVVTKEYDDPDTWTSMEPVYIQRCQTVMKSSSVYVNGKYESRYAPEQECTQVIAYWHSVQNYDGPHWKLKLRNADDEGWHSVTEREYQSYKIGEHYPRTTGAQG